MHLARPLPLTKRRPRPHRPAANCAPAVTPARERNRRANVTQDAALYSCNCGFVFTAPVTTSVGCPHCGSDQAW